MQQLQYMYIRNTEMYTTFQIPKVSVDDTGGQWTIGSNGPGKSDKIFFHTHPNKMSVEAATQIP